MDTRMKRKAEMELKNTELQRMELDFEKEKWNAENKERLYFIEK